MTCLYITAGLIILILLLFILAVMPAQRKNKTVEKLGVTKFAHRGLHNKDKGIPENSIYAFGEAIKRKIGIEIDLHLSKDNNTVVIHDTSTLRTTGKEGKVTEMTTAEISRLTLDGTSERVPFLNDVLELVDGTVPLLIELKVDGGNYAALCEAVFSQLDRYEGDYLVQSFDPRVLLWLKKNRPNVGRGQLATAILPINPILAFLMKNLLGNFLTKPHFIAYDHRFFNKISAPKMCKRIFGSQIYLWTVTEKAMLEENAKNGITSIFEGFKP